MRENKEFFDGAQHPLTHSAEISSVSSAAQRHRLIKHIIGEG
jgi:hypothetical protein